MHLSSCTVLIQISVCKFLYYLVRSTFCCSAATELLFGSLCSSSSITFLCFSSWTIRRPCSVPSTPAAAAFLSCARNVEFHDTLPFTAVWYVSQDSWNVYTRKLWGLHYWGTAPNTDDRPSLICGTKAGVLVKHSINFADRKGSDSWCISIGPEIQLARSYRNAKLCRVFFYGK